MSNVIYRLFVDHPRSVGETYAEHFSVASRFGFTMLAGGFACLVHAVFPALFERAGSRAIKNLYADMVSRQPGHARPAHEAPDWQLEYEI